MVLCKLRKQPQHSVGADKGVSANKKEQATLRLSLRFKLHRHRHDASAVSAPPLRLTSSCDRAMARDPLHMLRGGENTALCFRAPPTIVRSYAEVRASGASASTATFTAGADGKARQQGCGRDRRVNYHDNDRSLHSIL